MKKIAIALLLSAMVLAKPFFPEPMIKSVEKRYGPFAKERFVRMNQALNAISDKSERRILEEVNRFFNTAHYGSDMDTYQKRDYWATPWEFLGRDFGDSEDYVIAKYFALKYLGVNPRKLYFSYVASQEVKGSHMVLTYFETPSSVPLILDSLLQTIASADQRPDLTPIYHVNADTLMHAQVREKNRAVAMHKAHQQWDRLVNNIQRYKL